MPTMPPTILRTYRAYLSAYTARLHNTTFIEPAEPDLADLAAAALGSHHAAAPAAKPWAWSEVKAEVERMLAESEPGK